MRKKIVKIFLVFILFAITLYLLLKRDKAIQEPPPITSVRQPNIRNQPFQDKEFSVTFNLTEEPNIPSNLSIYRLRNEKISQDTVLNIAKLLGIETEPSISKDSLLGEIYIWSTQTDYLRIAPSAKLVDYKKRETLSAQNPFSDEDQIIEVAKNFLNQSRLFDNLEPEFTKVNYVITSIGKITITSKDSANLADVQFSQKVNGYPLINITPSVGTISVKIDKRDNISSAYIDKIGSFEEMGTSPIKNLEKIKNTTKDAKIVGYEEDSFDSSYLPQDFTTIEISKINIGYLKEFSQNQDILQPVFILEGRGQTKRNEDLAIKMYLSASDD